MILSTSTGACRLQIRTFTITSQNPVGLNQTRHIINTANAALTTTQSKGIEDWLIGNAFYVWICEKLSKGFKMIPTSECVMLT